jgi:gamma-tubulin complex component 2
LISESHAITKDHLKKEFNDVYWEQRYTLSDECVPEFLESNKEKILLTGKYLNVLKECDLQVADRIKMIEFFESKTSKEECLRLNQLSQEYNGYFLKKKV